MNVNYRHIAGLELMRLGRMLKYAMRRIRGFRPFSNDDLIIGYRSGGNYREAAWVNEYQLFNAYYGISSILRNYSGYKKAITASIEHGVYFSDKDSGEIAKYDLPLVITMGDFRKDALVDTIGRPIVSVGPYIAYAESLLSSRDLESTRARLGRTLLVFPSHSVEGSAVDYNSLRFQKEIERVRTALDIKTIVICLYFNDIPTFAQLYEDAGYLVVCAGHRIDNSFLNRLKTYIELSDAVLTNSIGTHVGYSLYLGKPVSYFNQELSYSYESSERQREVSPFSGTNSVEGCLNRIKNLLDGIHDRITDDQLDATEPFWGYGNIKTRNELNLLFTTSEAVFKHQSNECSYADVWKIKLGELNNSQRNSILRIL